MVKLNGKKNKGYFHKKYPFRFHLIGVEGVILKWFENTKFLNTERIAAFFYIIKHKFRFHAGLYLWILNVLRILTKSIRSGFNYRYLKTTLIQPS